MVQPGPNEHSISPNILAKYHYLLANQSYWNAQPLQPMGWASPANIRTNLNSICNWKSIFISSFMKKNSYNIVYTYLSTYIDLCGPLTKVSISMFNVYMAAWSKLPYILLFLIPQYGKSSPWAFFVRLNNNNNEGL